jgi:hypothetical protein
VTEKYTRLKTLENYIRRISKNVSRNGEWINFSCPLAPFSAEHKFKEDRSPSAGATIAHTNVVIWKCFTCKGSGPLTTMLRYLGNKKKVSYDEIIQSIQNSEELPEYESRFFCEELEAIEPLEYPDIFEDIEDFPNACKYLSSRGVSFVTAKKLGLKFDSDGARIVFPVCDFKGRIYGYTGRSIIPDHVPKIKDYYFQKSRFILGTEHWIKNRPVLIVEGLFGFAHLHEITKGKIFDFNVGAIMGSSASPEQINTLLSFGSPVYVLLDNDAAGRAGMFGKPIQADWSKRKKEEELQKGLTYQLKNHIPTFVLKWPEAENNIKNDPDDLTYDDLSAMVSKPRLVL